MAGVAHEINNPLAFVTNNMVVLQRDLTALRKLIEMYRAAHAVIAGVNPDAAREIDELAERIDVPYTLGNLPQMLERSREGLKRIQQIVGDLREFSRQESVGDLEDAVDLNAGVSSTVNIVRGRARVRRVEIETDLAPLPRVTCRAPKINQVVLNLIANAIDASPEHGKVTVRTRSDTPGWVEVSVTDTGGGIDPAVRDKIFDPFFTTKPQGQGTGLGLSISHGIVSEHGGRISVESTPGGGSTFSIHLPALRTRSDPGVIRVGVVGIGVGGPNAAGVTGSTGRRRASMASDSGGQASPTSAGAEPGNSVPAAGGAAAAGPAPDLASDNRWLRRRVAELERELARVGETQQAQRFLDSIVENIPDGVFVKDAAQLRFVRVNRAMEALCGFSAGSVVGRSDYDFFPKEEADFFVAKDRAVLDGGRMLEIPEETMHTPTGTRVLHTKKIPRARRARRRPVPARHHARHHRPQARRARAAREEPPARGGRPRRAGGDGGAAARAGPARAVREAGGARADGGGRRARDQQPAGVRHEQRRRAAARRRRAARAARRSTRAPTPAIAAGDPAAAERIRELASGSTCRTRWTTSTSCSSRSRDGLKRIQQIVNDLRDFARQEPTASSRTRST